MIKILLATRYFYMDKKEGTGIGRLSYEIARRLESTEGLQIQRVETKGSGLVDYFKYSMLDLPRIIKNSSADIYHALTPIEGMFMPKERTVVSYNDLFQITNPKLIGGGMGYNKIKHLIGTRYFERACKISSKAKRIICISEKTKEEVMRYLEVPEEKIRVITLGIPDELEPKKIPHEEFTIGYLGMLDKRKRVDLLVKDFHRSNIKARLLIGGRGLDEQLIWDLAEGDKRIAFLGFVKEDKLCEFYNLLDLFVFPTAIEGYGLPIVEALACKVPVVVLEDSLIPKEVKKYCVTTNRISNLLTQLELDGYNIEHNTKDGLEFAKSHKWSESIRKYLEVYKEVLDE